MIERTWVEVQRPSGNWGKSKNIAVAGLNQEYGQGNWKVGWVVENGIDGDREVMDRGGIFALAFLKGYLNFFKDNSEVAKDITENYSYMCDFSDPGSLTRATDAFYLWNDDSEMNEIHHVAANLAVIFLGYEFKGDEPLMMRSVRRFGELSPGKVIHPGADLLIPQGVGENGLAERYQWWDQGTIEDVYQRTKTIFVLGSSEAK
jgi:hypothetical protein